MRVWLKASASSLVFSCAVLGILAVNLAEVPAGWSDSCCMELGMRMRRGFLPEKSIRSARWSFISIKEQRPGQGNFGRRACLGRGIHWKQQCCKQWAEIPETGKPSYAARQQCTSHTNHCSFLNISYVLGVEGFFSGRSWVRLCWPYKVTKARPPPLLLS